MIPFILLNLPEGISKDSIPFFTSDIDAPASVANATENKILSIYPQKKKQGFIFCKT